MTNGPVGTRERLMTVGEFARRTGLSIKAVRQYEALGRARIATLRSLGFTIKEIDQLTSGYLSRPDEPLGPHLAALLDRAERRIDDRIAQA